MDTKQLLIALSTVSLTALMAGSSLGQVAQQIGVTAAVNPATRSTPPGAQTRTLVIGTDVVQRERIVTDAGGKAQILFLDQSALTVGQNADITLDEFVYSAEKSEGEISANVARGVMRFVGGKISKAGNVNFRTPTATIGIRGGIMLIDARNPNETIVVFLFGNFASITQQNGQQTMMRRPGFAARIPLNGPPQFFQPTPQQMAAWAAELEGTDPNGRSGARSLPGDANLQQFGIVQIGSNVLPGEYSDLPGIRLLGDRANGIHGISEQNFQSTLSTIRMPKMIYDPDGCGMFCY